MRQKRRTHLKKMVIHQYRIGMEHPYLVVMIFLMNLIQKQMTYLFNKLWILQILNQI